MRKSSQAEGSHSVVTKLGGWAKQAGEITPRLDRLNIGLRLTLCFAFIILAMLVGDAVLRWQFHVVQGQTERLRGGVAGSYQPHVVL
jgi:hypothetical protein